MIDYFTLWPNSSARSLFCSNAGHFGNPSLLGSPFSGKFTRRRAALLMPSER